MTTDARADLAQQVTAAREDLRLLARRVIALGDAYDALDLDRGTADGAAGIEVVDGLSDVGLALNDAAAAFDTAVWNANHLTAGGRTNRA